MNPQTHLRLEGLAVFAAATAAFFVLEGPWWLFALLILAPDVGMLGYLVGPDLGSRTYNALHSAAFPMLVGGGAWWVANEGLLLVSLVWLAHIGLDRAIGYGLKYPTRFTDTHLDRLASLR